VLFAPFDLSIQYGERVGIVGANGSGKTTLLKTITEGMVRARGDRHLAEPTLFVQGDA
jgi:ATPase subunit of ABC transporter with duplicated ATPase domains